MVFDPRAAKLLSDGEYMAIEGFPGLRLLANKKGKTWTYRYKGASGLKQVKLGAWPDMPLHEAIREWDSARASKEAGVDPAEKKKAAKKPVVQEPVDDEYRVRQLVQDFIQGHIEQERKPAGAKAAARILLSALDGSPELAAMPAHLVKRQHAFALLDSRKHVPTIAQKLRSLMGSAWDYALDAGRLDGDVPNWWQAVMKGRLRSKGKIIGGKHVGQKRRALTEEEVGLLLRWLPNMHKVGADTVVMYLWTGTRGSEILGMKPEHLAEKEGVLWWTVPKELTKNARFKDATDLRVPLLGRAREIVLRRLEDTDKGEFLFRGVGDKPYTQHTFSTYIYDLQPYSPKSKREGKTRGVLPVTDWTPHNLRRTTRTMLPSLGCPSEVAEAILGHVPSEIEATYNAYSYDAERLLWLSKLADKLEALAA